MDKKSLSPDLAWDIALRHLAHPEASEITVNGPTGWFVNVRGKRSRIQGIPEMSEAGYIKSIEGGILPLIQGNHEFDPENGYLFEGRLEIRHPSAVFNGRCHIVLPPATDRPQITIAKQSTTHTDLEKIAGTGSMSLEMMNFLSAAVKAECTIVVSGSTGAGKTTLLRSLADLYAPGERVGIAEDTPEIILRHDDVTYLHSMPWKPGFDPNSVATLSWVVQQFNRMRIDKFIIGETRGKEFADFLVAANSGSEGSMTTIHANSPQMALAKMAKFAMAGSPGETPLMINDDIARTIDLIVQIRKFRDGSRRVTAIQEVTDTVSAKGTIQTSRMYAYDEAERQFRKEAFPSDALKTRFAEYGIRSGTFQSPVGSLQKPHMTTNLATPTPTAASNGNPFKRQV